MEKIIQFGEGNFLRAFAEFFIQKAKDSGEEISVVITQPRTNTKIINDLKSQKCQYNVYLKGRQNGRVTDRTVRINCVSRCIDAVSEKEKLEELFKSDDLEIIISNTTEAGIRFERDNTDTFPAKLTRLLFERYKEGKKPLVFLPTELIEDNGTELKKCIIAYSELWKLEESFGEYIESCSFCNTLVDRIVTGHIDGDEDPCSVACEPYASWVIEADEKAKAALSFLTVSDEVYFCSDLKKYRERKVKLLNGAHTMSVLAAYMCGFEIVRDMMNDALFSRYIDAGLEEIKQTISMPKEELDSFAENVKERFGNPFIDHKLLDISLNSASKFKTRCLPSIIEYHDITGKAPKMLTFSFAALIAFYKACAEVRDSAEAIRLFDGDASEILENKFWEAELSFLKAPVKAHFESINTNGMKKALEEVVYDKTF